MKSAARCLFALNSVLAAWFALTAANGNSPFLEIVVKGSIGAGFPVSLGAASGMLALQWAGLTAATPDGETVPSILGWSLVALVSIGTYASVGWLSLKDWCRIRQGTRS